MTINDLTRIFVRPSIFDAEILPGAGDEIAFRCPSGIVIEGATVEKVEQFCGQWNVFVRYETTNCVGRFVEMTGWVCMSEVI